MDINDVVDYCEKQIANLNKIDNANGGTTGKRTSRMDPILIMDDIIEKLHLLDYLSKFCKERKRKPISRTYFAIRQDNEKTDEKVRNFVEIAYWLMSLSFEGGVNALNESNKSNNSSNAAKSLKNQR